jgi:deoxyxylulose-5-phosphate synthase
VQVPSAEMILTAADSLKKLSISFREDQIRELEKCGPFLAKGLGTTELSIDLKIGYELGLQTARIMIAERIMEVL